MDESDFEGTLVLEKLAEVGKLAPFIEAIDSDDFEKAGVLMRRGLALIVLYLMCP